VAVQGAGWLRAVRAPAPAGLRPRASFYAFAETIRAVTPETRGYLDASLVPEYGLLALPTFGHSLLWAARRPVSANNLGPYLDAAKFEAAERFFRTTSREEALAIAHGLGARYVLSAARGGLRPDQLAHHLQRGDGSARPGAAHLERFRLVAEGPRGGRPLRLMFPRGVPARGLPYKLFEVVEGAVIEVPAAPGAWVCAELPLETGVGRALRFRATPRGDADGRARLRVPHPTERPAAPEAVRATGPWRVASPSGLFPVRVREEDVRSGARIALGREEAVTMDPGPSLAACLEAAGVAADGGGAGSASDAEPAHPARAPAARR
jgi:hypothetical protein